MSDPLDNLKPALTQYHRQIAHYGCLGAFTGIGAAVGFLGTGGNPLGGGAGGVAGYGYGKMACPKLEPTIQKKLFDDQAALTPGESGKAVHAFSKTTGSFAKAVHMVSLVKGGHLPVTQAKV